MIRSVLSAFLFFGITGLVWAQDRQGNDTPGDWITKHFEKYGLYTTACDERPENGVLKQRCYIRYVDIFSEAPKFAAVVFFVFQKDRKTAIQYGSEPGTVMAADGLRVESGNGWVITWKATETCREGHDCLMSDEKEVADTLAAFSAGGELVQEFTDRHGAEQLLKWDLAGFAEAYSDYLKQSKARNLLD